MTKIIKKNNGVYYNLSLGKLPKGIPFNIYANGVKLDEVADFSLSSEGSSITVYKDEEYKSIFNDDKVKVRIELGDIKRDFDIKIERAIKEIVEEIKDKEFHDKVIEKAGVSYAEYMAWKLDMELDEEN